MKDRVEARLKALGLNPFEAATRVGLNRHFVDDILNGKKKSVRGGNLRKLAEALRCSPLYLTGEQDEPGEAPEPLVFTATHPPAKYLTVLGECEAGTYRSRRIMSTRPRQTVPIPLDPRFSVTEQGAYLVSDDSLLGSSVQQGMFLSCAQPAAHEREVGPIGPGVVVVIERSSGENGVETTAREVAAGGALAPNPVDPLAIGRLPWPEPLSEDGMVSRVVGVAIRAVRLF